jgi:hypothetical protein
MRKKHVRWKEQGVIVLPPWQMSKTTINDVLDCVEQHLENHVRIMAALREERINLNKRIVQIDELISKLQYPDLEPPSEPPFESEATPEVEPEHTNPPSPPLPLPELPPVALPVKEVAQPPAPLARMSPKKLNWDEVMFQGKVIKRGEKSKIIRQYVIEHGPIAKVAVLDHFAAGDSRERNRLLSLICGLTHYASRQILEKNGMLSSGQS